MSNVIYSQGVIEYDKEYYVDFHIYDSTNNILKKSLNESTKKNSTPEELVSSYFFATDSISLKKLYFIKSDYIPKKQKHFDAIKQMDNDKNYVTLLHKFVYEHDGSQMCYINYIFKYENIDFTMPTNMSCIKKDDQWYIYQIGNQIRINDFLWTFKSCKIFEIINGLEVYNSKMNDLIKATRSNDNFLDVNKLYLLSSKFNEDDLEFFTMKKDNSCQDNIGNYIKNKKLVSSFLWKSIEIDKFEDISSLETKNLIKSLKSKPTDSICLKSRLKVEYENKVYSILKYNDCLTGKTLTRVSSNELPLTVKFFFFLFEKLNSKFLFDLANQNFSNDLKNQNFLQIYKNTRGQVNALNTTKLYNLFQQNKIIFKEYLLE
ncbi:hypothetical protein V3R08_14575 [Flavobacterium oreochromis]